jgi:hypothetical protein
MTEQPLRILFVKHTLAWPRAAGHDVHCFFMMKALSALGMQIALVTHDPIDPRAIDGVPLTACAAFAEAGGGSNLAERAALTTLQERFRSYFGIERAHIGLVGEMAERTRADAVVAVGLEALPYLASAGRALGVWYAADEWVYHHLSCLRPTEPRSWKHAKEALIKCLYERAYTGAEAALTLADGPDEWGRHLMALWADPARPRRLGCAARQWVVDNHSWRATAADAVAGLERSAQPPRQPAESAPGRT